MADFLKGDVTIPHVGKFPKAAVAGGLAGVGVLIVIEYRKRAQAAAAAPAAAPAAASDGTGDAAGTAAYAAGDNTDAYPWDGTYDETGDPYSMDTGSGSTYGDEGGSDGYTGFDSGAPAGPPFTTNAAWSQYVLSYFTQNPFPDLNGLTAAIGKYLAGQTVSVQEQGYINDATAIGGPAPVAGANGYPPSIRVSGSTGTSGSSKNQPPKTAPVVTPTTSASQLTVSWPAVGGATKYNAVVSGPDAGTKADVTVTANRAVFSVATAGSPGTAKVRAGNAAGWGPFSPAKSFKFTSPATRAVAKK